MTYEPLKCAAIALAALIGSAGLVYPQTTNSTNSGGTHAAASVPKADHSFATKAARAGLAEVAAAQIALQKSSNQDVKNFAQRMVDDHTKANDQLKSIASQEGIKLPTSPSSADQKKAEALQKLSGNAFDRRYVSDQITAHKEAVSLFTTESKSGKDSSLQSFAAQTLPILQDHYRMVQSISSGMKNPSRTSSAH